MSCNENSSYSPSTSQEVMPTASKIDAMVEPDKALEAVERKLIKEGYVEFETNDLEDSRARIMNSVKKYKGYISSDQEFTSPERVSQTIHIRIPSSYFDTLLSIISEGVHSFDRKEVFIKDITEEFLDVEARLKVKKELEARYLELLKQAGKINEIMEIERELAQIRGDVESIEGRYKYLSNQVTYSTLNITYYKSIPVYHAFGSKFSQGFAKGWNNLMLFFVFLVNLWPFVIIIAGLVFWRIRWKRSKAIKEIQS